MELSRADERAHVLTMSGETEVWAFSLGPDADGRAVSVTLTLSATHAAYRLGGVGLGWPLVDITAVELALPRRPTLEVRGPGLWADFVCEEPGRRWTLGLEAFGVGLTADEPPGPEARGDVVAVGFDLEWEGTAVVRQPGGYAVVARVHGELLVGDDTAEIEAEGRWSHTWA